MRLFIIVLLVLFSQPLLAKSQPITACFSDWYPFSYLKDNRPAGFSIELYRAVIERAGLQIVFKHRPWKRCRIEVINGLLDAAVDGGVNMENTLYAKKRPIPWVVLFWVNQSSAYQKFEDYSQFEGKRIAYVRGYGYPQEFSDYNGFNKNAVTNDLQGLKMLVAGRVSAFFGDIVNGTQLAKKHNLLVHTIGPAAQIKTLTLSFHKSRAIEHQKFEAALIEMYGDGSIDVLYQKYVGTTYKRFMDKYSDIFSESNNAQ